MPTINVLHIPAEGTPRGVEIPNTYEGIAAITGWPHHNPLTRLLDVNSLEARVFGYAVSLITDPNNSGHPVNPLATRLLRQHRPDLNVQVYGDAVVATAVEDSLIGSLPMDRSRALMRGLLRGGRGNVVGQ